MSADWHVFTPAEQRVLRKAMEQSVSVAERGDPTEFRYRLCSFFGALQQAAGYEHNEMWDRLKQAPVSSSEHGGTR